MISASLVGVNVYEVVVDGSDGAEETIHQVSLSPDYYRKLTGGTITHEWLIIQSFRFLLEREPASAILASFDLEDVNRYFPEFEEEIRRRVGWAGPS